MSLTRLAARGAIIVALGTLSACSPSAVRLHGVPAAGPTTPHPAPGQAVVAVSAAARPSAAMIVVATQTPCASGDQVCPGLQRSTDRGRTWRRLATPPGIGRRPILSIVFADTVHGWLSAGAPDSPGRLWATSDAGLTWHRLSPQVAGALATLDGRVWAVLPVRGERVLAFAGKGGVFRRVSGAAGSDVVAMNGVVLVATDDDARGTRPTVTVVGAGTTQAPLPCHDVAGSFAVAALGRRRLLTVCGSQPGAGNQVKTAFVSDDLGAHWRRTRSAPGQGGYVRIASAAGDRVVVAGSRMPVVVSPDGGDTWRLTGTFGAGDGFRVITLSRSRGVAVPIGTPTRLYLTDDGGRHWYPTSAVP